MIKLDVQPYCQNCLDFRPDVERTDILMTDDTVVNVGEIDTIIRCRHRQRCAIIHHYLKDECTKEINQKIENDRKAKRNGKN